jgi:hypothetical protein
MSDTSVQKLSEHTSRPSRRMHKVVGMLWAVEAILLLGSITSYALQTISTTGNNAGNSSFSASCSNLNPPSILNRHELFLALQNGRAYQHDNFLTETQVQFLLTELQTLQDEGKFITKGLSNTADQAQQFSTRQDRSICPVPWFVGALHQGLLDLEDREGIPAKLQQLQKELSLLLDRPTLANADLNHECYYSLSNVGSFLPRHMDERHEELKGAQGWLFPSRRSLSWLIYLSEPADWDIVHNGGALRTFPQEQRSMHGTAPGSRKSRTASTHEENLQVGWVLSDQGHSVPIYMDSFYVPPGGQEWYCILYLVEKHLDQKTYLTRPWLTEALGGMSVSEFLRACADHDAASSDNLLLLFDSSQRARQFHLIEDRQAWNDGHPPHGSIVEDIAPLRGRLVVFDSVQLPHEVLKIQSGTRRALAGWFHEKTPELTERI